MPTSKCSECESIYWAAERESLERWELGHHQGSFKKAEPGSLAEIIGTDGFHDCRCFGEYSEISSTLMRIRIYNYNRLVETEIVREDD